MPTPKEIERIKALINDPNVSEKTKGLLRTKLDTYLASKAPSVAPPAPAVAPAEALGGGGPGGAVGGGGGSAPGGDPYEEAHAAREAELGTSAPEEPGPSLPPPSLWQEIGGASASALAGLDSTVTGGVLTALTRKAAPEIGQAVDMARAEFPWANIAARVAGMRVPGLGRSIGKLSAEGAGLKAGQGIANTVMRGGLAGGAGAGTQGAVEAVVAGEDPLEAFGSAYPIGFMLGMPAALVGKAGEWLQNRNRDAVRPEGRDLQLLERGGGTTDTVSGVRPGPREAELVEEATAQGGVSPERVAAERVVPVLGDELERGLARATAGRAAPTQAEMDAADWAAAERLGSALSAGQGRTLSSIGMQNKAMYEETAEVSMRPLMTKQLELLRKATHEGRLPGQNVRGVVDALRKTADVKVVPRTSPEAHSAEPGDMLDVGYARHLGIIRGSPTPADAESVVVLTPRSLPAEAVDAVTRGLSDQAKEHAALFSPAAGPAKAMAGAAREARSEFGPEWSETKALQSDALRRMKNANQAAGLNRNVDDVDLGEFGTRDALYNAARSYGQPGNAVRDAELDRLAMTDQGLRTTLDRAARLRADKGAERVVPLDVENSLRAAGLPATTERVELGKFDTLDALYRAVRRYRTEGNAIADRELDRLAAQNPDLRSMLDDYAGAAAYGRLRGSADIEFTPKGNVSPYGITGATRLHLDPLARWLSTGSMVPVPAAATAITEQRRGK